MKQIPENLLEVVLDAVMTDWEETNDGYRRGSVGEGVSRDSIEGKAAEMVYRSQLACVILPKVFQWLEQNPTEASKLLLVSK